MTKCPGWQYEISRLGEANTEAEIMSEEREIR